MYTKNGMPVSAHFPRGKAAKLPTKSMRPTTTSHDYNSSILFIYYYNVLTGKDSS